jgi:hypothetical protein
MDLAPLHWQQLPLILGVLVVASGSLYALLALALPRRQAWAPRDGQGLDSEAMPALVPLRSQAGHSQPRHSARLAPR